MRVVRGRRLQQRKFKEGMMAGNTLCHPTETQGNHLTLISPSPSSASASWRRMKPVLGRVPVAHSTMAPSGSATPPLVTSWDLPAAAALGAAEALDLLPLTAAAEPLAPAAASTSR